MPIYCCYFSYLHYLKQVIAKFSEKVYKNIKLILIQEQHLLQLFNNFQITIHPIIIQKQNQQYIKYSDVVNIQLNRPPKNKLKVRMAQEYTVDNLATELDLYLAASARRNNFISKPIVLRAEFKALPAVSDAQKKVYEIDMRQLISFKDSFTDKQYKYIRLHDWEFYLKFQGKVCKSIQLNCQYIVLIANKNLKKQIKDCNFSITVANSQDIKKFTKQHTGYLNRLGKRNLVTLSQYVAEEHFALINFVKKPLTFNAVQKICMPPPQKPQEDALSYLNNRGKQILQKLRHFITRQDLLNFMVDQELSDEGQRQMRRIILSDVLGQTKKKGGYQRSIIQALQKNLVD